MAQTQREEDCIKQLKETPIPGVIVGGPRFYQPSASEKLAVIADFRKVAYTVIPENMFFSWAVLWHPDLHGNNIFVDPEDPTKILGIIDWQGAHVTPMLNQVTTPPFLNYDGPLPRGGITPPSLPDNFDQMDPERQQRKRELLKHQSLYKEYELQARRENTRVYWTSRYISSIGHDIMTLTSHVFTDGEPIIRGMLIELAHL